MNKSCDGCIEEYNQMFWDVRRGYNIAVTLDDYTIPFCKNHYFVMTCDDDGKLITGFIPKQEDNYKAQCEMKKDKRKGEK